MPFRNWYPISISLLRRLGGSTKLHQSHELYCCQISESSIQTFKMSVTLRQETENAILSLGKKTKLAQNFLHHLFKEPIVDSQDVASAFSITLTTALSLIKDFVRLGILQEITGYKRNRIFDFDKCIKLFS